MQKDGTQPGADSFGPPWYKSSMDGRNRADVRLGQRVSIVLKRDQPTGKLTEGIVSRILTNSSFHPHGIKVQMEDGQVGRVKEIHEG